MQELSTEERIEICEECPIFNKGRCNSNLWINPKTDEVSTYAKIGFVRGCNCIIKIKARNKYNHCVAGKW